MGLTEAVLDVPWAVLGPSWAVLGLSEAVLGPPWAPHGALGRSDIEGKAVCFLAAWVGSARLLAEKTCSYLAQAIERGQLMLELCQQQQTLSTGLNN